MITKARGAGIFYVRVQSHRRHDLLVHLDIYLDTSLSSPLEHPIEAPLLIVGRRSAQVDLWAEPPVADPYGVYGLVEDLGERPEVVVSVCAGSGPSERERRV